MFKIIGYILGGLVVIGMLKGAGQVDLSGGQQSLGDAAMAIINGVADVTIRLIPTVIDAISGLTGQLPDNGDYSPPKVGQ